MPATEKTATDRPGLTVGVDHGTQQPASVAAGLVDCSRAEVQLLVAAPLVLDEGVLIRLRDEQSGLQLDVAAVVSWQRPKAEGWLIGCKFTHELDWETLGELFLCGILEATF